MQHTSYKSEISRLTVRSIGLPVIYLKFRKRNFQHSRFKQNVLIFFLFIFKCKLNYIVL